MSLLLSTIADELGPQALSQIGSSVGATPEQTQAAVAAALPALLAGLAKNASDPQGAQALAGALDTNHTPQGAPAALNGGGILGHVLGDQQGVVAQKVAQASGLSPATVARLLPILAPGALVRSGLLGKHFG